MLEKGHLRACRFIPSPLYWCQVLAAGNGIITYVPTTGSPVLALGWLLLVAFVSLVLASQTSVVAAVVAFVAVACERGYSLLAVCRHLPRSSVHFSAVVWNAVSFVAPMQVSNCDILHTS
mmetsp:Transcript_44861/g.66583  ORF Transcript_44861/g.66583 Transcript_44861/m.66583 type:complete len:120 (+) Transcript_44861:67-426(+)